MFSSYHTQWRGCNIRKQCRSGKQNGPFLYSNAVLIITDCPPANQIQKILDHGHLLTVHDPEQESSELDTVILKALVKGKVPCEKYVIKKLAIFSGCAITGIETWWSHGTSALTFWVVHRAANLLTSRTSCLWVGVCACVPVCMSQLVRAKVRKLKTSWMNWSWLWPGTGWILPRVTSLMGMWSGRWEEYIVTS